MSDASKPPLTEDVLARKRDRALKRIAKERASPPLLARTPPTGRDAPDGTLRRLVECLLHPGAFLRGGFDAAREAARPLVSDPRLAEPFAWTVAEYHQRYFRSEFMRGIFWMGVPALKMVSDLWIYQELLVERRPDVVVEIGSHFGGSTLFIAHVMDMIGSGAVVSVDISREVFQAEHPRIATVTGDSGDPAVLEQVRALVDGKSVMVVHDGDHAEAAVKRDLDLYADLVSVGQSLIVEDGIVDVFNPERYVLRDMDGGPLKAVNSFLAERDGAFVREDLDLRFVMSASSGGYLRRVR